MTHAAAIVAEARRWLGTPYHHAADIHGAGVDCGMLLVRVFVDTHLVPPFDPRPYPPDWFLHRDAERYIDWLDDRFDQVEAAKPGDVALFRNGRCFAHGGIVTAAEPFIIVHAYSPMRAVVEHRVDQVADLIGRARRFYRIKPPMKQAMKAETSLA